MVDRNEPGLLIPVPLPENRVFRNQAMDDILSLLYRNPHEAFGVRELRSVTGHGGQTVDTAIECLGQLALIETRRRGNRKEISINRTRIARPEDPIMAIPQESFRTPVAAFMEELQATQDTLVGVVLFGSVARGEADRISDIDLLIIVEDGVTAARRSIHDMRQAMEHRTFDGDRYEYQVMVESITSARQYGEKLQDIFTTGITLYETDRLETVRRQVLHGQ